MGFFAGKWAVSLCLLLGWAIALCFAFAGGYLERRLVAELDRQLCPRELLDERSNQTIQQTAGRSDA